MTHWHLSQSFQSPGLSSSMHVIFHRVSVLIIATANYDYATAQDRAFHRPLERKLLIASLIRVFLQPSGSYIHQPTSSRFFVRK